MRRSHILQMTNNHWCCFVDGEGVGKKISAILFRLVYITYIHQMVLLDPLAQIPRIISNIDLIPNDGSQSTGRAITKKPNSTLRKTSSFSFINPNNDSVTSPPLNVQSSSSQVNTVEINPELDMLMSLCESDVDAQAKRIQLEKSQKKDQQLKPKILKRKHDSVFKIDDDEPDHESLTTSLLEICNATKFSTIPIPWNKFDDIDEVTREEAKEISDNILYRNGSMRMIAVVIATPRESISSSAADGQLRKSRRKSSSVYAGKDNLVEKWVIGKVIREANVEERRLGFTHVLHVNNNADPQEGDFLVNLTLFGYYDIDRHRQLKPDKLGMPLDRWVGLKAVNKSKK